MDHAVGGCPEPRPHGVPMNGTLISVYVMSGLSGAIGGMLFVGTADAGSPFTGQGMELSAIAAVIIGGGSFLGGRGGVLNALTGALILGVMHNGLNLLGLDPNFQYIAVEWSSSSRSSSTSCGPSSRTGSEACRRGSHD